MGDRGSAPQLRALESQDEQAFAELCSYTKAAFADAVDLVLIHNEREVRGDQPRRALNPLIVLLAVAAWERFVVDIEAVASGQWKKAGWYPKAKGIAYLHQAVRVLGPASGGALPGAWTVRVFSAWRGRAPRSPQVLGGEVDGKLTPALSEQVRSWIDLRNKVAHRCLPQQHVIDQDTGETVKWPDWWSDADSHTVQAGEARAALAELMQLTDQAVLAIATAARFPDVNALRLRQEWFAAALPAGIRGVEVPGTLWGGQALPRP